MTSRSRKARRVVGLLCLTGAVVVTGLTAGAGLAQAGQSRYDGLKSSYPQLHALRTVPRYDGLKSGYPQLHAILASPQAAPTVRTVSAEPGFDWADAGVGVAAGVAMCGLLALAGTKLARTRITAVR
jgi:hypothetical protein